MQAEFETNLKLGTKVTIRSVHPLLQPITRVSDVVIEEVLSDINSILAASQRSCDATVATSPKQKSCANTRQKPPYGISQADPTKEADPTKVGHNDKMSK